jgi:hypothetical protein
VSFAATVLKNAPQFNKRIKITIMKPNNENAKLAGKPPKESSPQVQQEFDLNKDVTRQTKKVKGKN